jgi:hypothetical protein
MAASHICDIGSYFSIFNSIFQASYQTCFHEDYQQKLFVLCFETIFENTIRKPFFFFFFFGVVSENLFVQ